MTPSAASAQADWPTKDIKIIVPFAAGGPTDHLARLLIEKLSPALKRGISLENRGGAGGNAGASLVAKAPPDGYTLLLAQVGVLAINQSLYKTLPFDPDADFAPVGIVGSGPVALVTSPNGPKDVAALRDLAKPGAPPLTYGSAGNGTPGHLAGEMFRATSSLAIEHAPLNGNAGALQNLLTGRIPLLFSPIQGVAEQVKSGQVRALAVLSERRSPIWPDVPTATEAGIPVVAESWWALVAPANTPEAITSRLISEISSIAATEDWKRELEALGVNPKFVGGRDFVAFREAEVAKWRTAVKTSGATAD